MNIPEELDKIAREIQAAEAGWFFNTHGSRMIDCIYRLELHERVAVEKITDMGKTVNDKLENGQKVAEKEGFETSHIITARFHKDRRGDTWIQGAFSIYGEGLVPEMVWGLFD